MNKSLVLTGMMGVGKTTIGILLSKRIKYRFVDIDSLIEKKEKKTVKEIFEKRGEKYFRKIEERESLKFLKKDRLILALGGGAFINTKIRKEVLSNTISFWLDIDIDNLLKRKIIVKKRPLLSNKNLEKTLIEIYNKRKVVYELANFKIDCNKLNKEQIIRKINKIYKNL